jgi:hypothetical protein
MPGYDEPPCGAPIDGMTFEWTATEERVAA